MFDFGTSSAIVCSQESEEYLQPLQDPNSGEEIMLNHQDAAKQALQLRKQRVPFAKIVDHLKSAGYVSDRTGQPVKEMAIRYMVSKEEQRQKDEAKRDHKEEVEEIKVYVATAERTFKDNVRVLLSMKDFNADTKIKLIEALMVEEKSAAKSKGSDSWLITTNGRENYARCVVCPSGSQRLSVQNEGCPTMSWTRCSEIT